MSLGAAAGITADRLFHADYANAVSVAILVYLASYYVARYRWFKSLPSGQMGKVYTTGLFGFVMLFIFVWILLFTLIS